MIYKYLLPLLALCGAIAGLLIVHRDKQTLPVPPIAFPPAISPYQYAIAALGIIEASSQNISIGSPFNEVVTKVHVKEGDHVKAGDILFELDTRVFEANLEAAKANLKSAAVALEDKQKQFSFYQRLQNPKAVSEQSYQQNNYAMLEAEQNVAVAQSNILQSIAQIQKSTIISPIDGEILQLNVHVGEIAPVTPVVDPLSLWQTISNGTLILMGQTNPLQVRIDIDEADAWRFVADAPAMGYVRGNRNINFPLKFVRIEPYIIPKRSLSGTVTERVDTRVLQVLYQFEKNDQPIYTGQLLDIFIESKPFNTLQQ